MPARGELNNVPTSDGGYHEWTESKADDAPLDTRVVSNKQYGMAYVIVPSFETAALSLHALFRNFASPRKLQSFVRNRNKIQATTWDGESGCVRLDKNIKLQNGFVGYGHDRRHISRLKVGHSVRIISCYVHGQSFPGLTTKPCCMYLT